MNLSEFERDNSLALLAAPGGGFDAYVVDKAQKLAKAHPEWHGGLPAEVDAAMGAERAADARRALAWFGRNA